MTGIEYRTDAESILAPRTRERMLGGGSVQLITVQLSDTGYHVNQDGRELPPRTAVRCELRSQEARQLAASLLDHAEQADRLIRERDR